MKHRHHHLTLGPPIGFVRRDNFSKTRLARDQGADLWCIIGPTVEINMRKGVQLWEIFVVCYFQGLENATNLSSTEKRDEDMLQFFTYEHLPEAMQKVSKPFCDLARSIMETLPQNPERTVALRKLLEAKDCAVRASIYKSE